MLTKKKKTMMMMMKMSMMLTMKMTKMMMMKIKMRMMLSACLTGLTGQSAQLFSYSGEPRVLQRSGSIWV